MRQAHVRLTFAFAIVACGLLIAPAAATQLQPVPAAVPAAATDAAAFDIDDATLILLLALEVGYEPTRLPLLPPSTESIATISARLATRGGTTLSAQDAAALDTIDARIAAPVAHLLATMELTWDMRDAAFSRVTEAELLELKDYDIRNGNVTRWNELRANIDFELLINAAILLIDTTENVVIPQLQALSESDAWPENPIADSVGVLRIGGTGNDVETIYRILQIDARGNDTYLNNAGATTILNSLRDIEMQTPISISIDLQGNDTYTQTRNIPAQGAGFAGIGGLWELAGDDAYDCYSLCLGSSGLGLALIHEYSGADAYSGRYQTVGYSDGIAAFREDHGDDTYNVNYLSAGAAYGRQAIAILWERQGNEHYETRTVWADERYGWGVNGGFGFLVDEGDGFDVYETATVGLPQHIHGCNNCEWKIGSGFHGGPARGGGNDNHGGLAKVLTYSFDLGT